MMDVIGYATASELISMIEAGNLLVAGMTPAEAAAALGVIESGKIVAYNIIETAGGQAIQLTGQTAAEAFEYYQTAGGVISAIGAASQSASSTANLTEIITLPQTPEAAVGVAGILTVSLPAWVAAVAPLLGVAIGAGLYSLAPEFWEKVSRALLPFCYDDTEVLPAVVKADGQVYVEGAAVDALKDLFDDELVGEQTYKESSLDTGGIPQPIPNYNQVSFTSGNGRYNWTISGFQTFSSTMYFVRENNTLVAYLTDSLHETFQQLRHDNQTGTDSSQTIYASNSVTIDDKTVNFIVIQQSNVDVSSLSDSVPILDTFPVVFQSNINNTAWTVQNGDSVGGYPAGTSAWGGTIVPDYTVGAINVVEAASPSLYTAPYYPVQLPIGDPLTSNDPEVYPNPSSPTPLPSVEPNISPEVSPNQFPEEIPSPGKNARTAPLTNPVPSTEPSFNPNLDPSQQPLIDPEPALEPPSPPASSGTSPSPLFPPINFPDIVPDDGSSGFIHVYNPTTQEMIDFGKWLWVTWQDTTIDKLWNNPFDGILSAHELYATPTVSVNEENIRSGFLTSTVLSKVVTQRYSSIDCGSLVIPEYYANYLDYSPYSKAYLYLPFIGIVELNVDDIVGHAVNVLYHIDAYNGSCIAQITVAKDNYSNTIYQFSGNCAVDIPLAGGSQAAIKAGLISAAATGISSVIGGIATALTGNIAGAVGGMAYGLGGAVSHAVSQKSSVQHSGTFGSSYGAMGIKIPYLIIRRPIQKYVMNYNEDYGFPSHKRVVIGSCSGFLRVREVDVISPSATDEEKAKIEELLKQGVYIN